LTAIDQTRIHPWRAAPPQEDGKALASGTEPLGGAGGSRGGRRSGTGFHTSITPSSQGSPQPSDLGARSSSPQQNAENDVSRKAVVMIILRLRRRVISTLTASGYPLIHSAFARCQERWALQGVAPHAWLLGDDDRSAAFNRKARLAVKDFRPMRSIATCAWRRRQGAHWPKVRTNGDGQPARA
jgi:hypothetical protein